MNLYRIETRGLGEFYIVSSDPTSAYAVLRQFLDKGEGYGFENERQLKEIHEIARSDTYGSVKLGEAPKLFLDIEIKGAP